MTNEQLFEDLKQFIATTVSQQTAGLPTKDDLERIEHRMDGLDQRMGRLETKIDQIQDAVAEAISSANEVTDETLKDHERRLRRLEHRPA